MSKNPENDNRSDQMNPNNDKYWSSREEDDSDEYGSYYWPFE